MPVSVPPSPAVPAGTCANPSWSALRQGLDGDVRALAVFDDGSGAALYAGGEFVNANNGAGSFVVNRVAKWDGTRWSALGSPPGTDGAVTSLAVATIPAGNGPFLYVGGTFLTAGGVPASYVARWDGQQWSSVGPGIGAPGAGCMAVFAGKLCVGSTGSMFFWDGSSWSNYPSSCGLNFSSLAAVGTKLFSTGSHNCGNGTFLRVWEITPLAAIQIGTQFNNPPPYSQGAGCGAFGGNLFAAGIFINVNGVPATNIARFDPQTQAWSPLGSGLNSQSLAMLSHDDAGAGSDSLFVGGSFTNAGGSGANYITKWDGATWSPLGIGVNGEVRALAQYDDGQGGGPALYVGGAFTTAGGRSANRVARWGCQGNVSKHCTAKVNSNGCTPAIGYSGAPSTSSSAPFFVSATNELNGKTGLLFYGAGAAVLPFQGGTLCVQPPIVRTPQQDSGGNPPPANDCSGTYSFDFNAWIQSGVDPALVTGVLVDTQYWARDPLDPAGFGTSLSDALEFTILL